MRPLARPELRPDNEVEYNRQQYLQFGVTMSEPTVDISGIAIATKLSRLTALRGVRALWTEALPWIRSLSQAVAVSLVYSGAHLVEMKEGQLSAAVAADLSEWEKPWIEQPTTLWPREYFLQSTGVMPTRMTPDGHHIVPVTLSRGGRPLGVLSVVYDELEGTSRAYHSSVQTIIHMITNLAVLQDELLTSQTRLEQVSLFYQIGQMLASTLNLKQILRETTELTMVVLDVEAATLFRLDEETEELIFAIPTGEKGEVLHEFRIPADQGIVGWVVQTGESTLVNDVQTDSRFTSLVDIHTGFVTRNLVCVPLKYQGRVTGALEILNKRTPEGFTEDDVQWLTTLATQAAIAIENARLYESLRQERDRIIAVQEDVRHRLARGLHDGPAQDLARIILDVEYARRIIRKSPNRADEILDEIEGMARRANRSVRQFLFELRPVILETRGLVATLRSYLQQWQDMESITCHLEESDSLEDLDTQAAAVVFSIIQEAFNNLRKHAHAQNAWIRLQRRNDSLRIEIEDDGAGFDVDAVLSNYDERNSFGLLNMREQAQLLDGTLEFESPSPRLGRGTLVTLEVSCDRVKRKT